MSKNGPSPDTHRKFAGKTLMEWEDEWEEVEGGFSQDHPELHGVLGLYRADLNGKAKVIGSGTDINGGGLAKRLQTLRSKLLQTGNNYETAQYIRKNMELLTLRVIKVSKGGGDDLIIREIAKQMRLLHGLRKGVVTPD